MYKVDLKTLKEITKTLDDITNNSPESIEVIKARIKARKLSQKIKDNYTEVKIS